MNRIVATLVVALAAVMAGCGQKEVPSTNYPSASDKFDKRELPNINPGRRAAPG